MVTLLAGEEDQVVMVVMGLLMGEVVAGEMAVMAISLEVTVGAVVTIVHQGKAAKAALGILAMEIQEVVETPLAHVRLLFTF